MGLRPQLAGLPVAGTSALTACSMCSGTGRGSGRAAWRTSRSRGRFRSSSGPAPQSNGSRPPALPCLPVPSRVRAYPRDCLGGPLYYVPGVQLRCFGGAALALVAEPRSQSMLSAPVLRPSEGPTGRPYGSQHSGCCGSNSACAPVETRPTCSQSATPLAAFTCSVAWRRHAGGPSAHSGAFTVCAAGTSISTALPA